MTAILFVCKANICRSPVMAFAFASSAAKNVDVAVSSAGTATSSGLGICEIGAAVIAAEPEGIAYAERHHSTALDAGQLARHDLIVVASREERAATARLLPSSRGGLFTLREAVELGRKPFDAAELKLVQGTLRAESLAAYAFLLDARRGTLDLQPRRGLFTRAASPMAQLDIPDFHHGRRRAHVQGVKGVLAETSALATQVSRGMHQIQQLSQS
ncbi:hypothetical protein FIV50_02495 [Microbacterium foliorum]|uniref:Phosphotyrosine protein phosphatase I domain-containing protein n=1 Tax=Microbacterium foliorum TaxID=104336 RepID=A0A4Y5YM61_9MICO|nr:hypothetical protein [Microbacterium foliorum]QDE33764.1 hypothetical protein FIV50_02495 [Microbacterium foliorum]